MKDFEEDIKEYTAAVYAACHAAGDVVRALKLEDVGVTAQVVKDNRLDSGWIVRLRGKRRYLVELDDSLKAFTVFKDSHSGKIEEYNGPAKQVKELNGIMTDAITGAITPTEANKRLRRVKEQA
jgi:hypothetical protein